MQTIFHNVYPLKPLNAEDQCAVSLSVSVSPDLAHARITTMLSIGAARELAMKIAQAADAAELKLGEK